MVSETYIWMNWLNHVNLHSVKLHIIFMELLFKIYSRLRRLLLAIVTMLYLQSLKFVSLALAEKCESFDQHLSKPCPPNAATGNTNLLLILRVQVLESLCLTYSTYTMSSKFIVVENDKIPFFWRLHAFHCGYLPHFLHSSSDYLGYCAQCCIEHRNRHLFKMLDCISFAICLVLVLQD